MPKCKQIHRVFVRFAAYLDRKACMDIVNFFVNLLSDPRGAIAGWILTLCAVWVYTP